MEVSWFLCAVTAASYSALSELGGLGALVKGSARGLGAVVRGSAGGFGAGTVAMVGDWLERRGNGYMGWLWVDGCEDEGMRSECSTPQHDTRKTIRSTL